MNLTTRLRHRITIQQATTAQDPVTGETVATWVDVFPEDTAAGGTPAEVGPISVREFIQSGASQSELSAKIVIRYRPGIKASMRILHEAEGRIYNIEGVLADKKSGREYLTLPVSEGVNDGE